MKISTTINSYFFRNNTHEYVIHNYDYFTNDYGLPKNQKLNELHEYSIMSRIVNSIDRSKSVVDIGANCGLFCVPISLQGYRVFAFEPISMNTTLLEMNKKVNNCNTLEIIHKGIFDKEVEQKIFIPYCSDNTSFNKDVAVSNMKSKEYIEETVQCITFDQWIIQNPKVNVGFIKIDVQGYEQQVLMGMKNFLKNCQDVHIFIEWDKKHTESAGNSLNTIYNILIDSGFVEVQNFGNDKHFYKK